MRWVVALGTVALAHWPHSPPACSCPWDGEPAEIAASGDPVRGEYVLRLGGCVTCHTDEKNGGAFLAGGRALGSPFGTFYTSNITPDPATGIGGWSTGAFVRAMTEGVSPDGHPYFPAFPYTSYTKMRLDDLVDLKAYLDTVEPVANPVPDHDLRFPFGFRPLLRGWQLLFFEKGTFQPDPARSETWNRGAYIVNGPGHCANATPRATPLGGAQDAIASSPAPATGRTASRCRTSRRIQRTASAAGPRPMSPSRSRPASCLMATCSAGRWRRWWRTRPAIGPIEDREAVAEYLFTVPPLEDAPAPAEQEPAQEG